MRLVYPPKRVNRVVRYKTDSGGGSLWLSGEAINHTFISCLYPLSLLCGFVMKFIKLCNE